MNYTLPIEELVNIFNKSFIQPILSTLWIQQHNTFEEVVSQVVLIEKVKIQDEDFKVKNKDNYQKFNKENIEDNLPK